MRRKKQVQEQNYWRERWLDYAWWAILGFEENERPKTRRKNGLQLSFDPGRVTLLTPQRNYGHHRTTFKVKPLGKRAWKQVLDRLAQTPEVQQNLLAGRPGAELEDLMDKLDLELFPLTGESAFRCDCEAWQCNHRTYLINAVAEQLEQNPFLWLTIMGLERGELLAGISARQEDALPGGAGPALDQARFWSTPKVPDQITVRPGEAVAPDALLRRLGPLPLPEAASVVTFVERREVKTKWGIEVVQDLVQIPADQALHRYAHLIGTGAAALAKGESMPTLAPAKLPGKAVPTKQRLLPEIIQAVQEAGRPLALSEIAAVAPTASTLSDQQRQRALPDALAELPEPYRIMGRIYVADRTTVLEGARFRQSITFEQWYDRCLSMDGEWIRALAAARSEMPIYVQVGNQRYALHTEHQTLAGLFAALQPNLGDQLEWTVLDPVMPLLGLSVRPTTAKPSAQDAVNERARTLLRQVIPSAGFLTDVDSVGLLLAAGLYAGDAIPQPIWLEALHAPEYGLALGGPRRHLIAENWQAWRPRFGRRPLGEWPGGPDQFVAYQHQLHTSGIWSGEDQFRTLHWLREWIRLNPGAHDTKEGAPTIASFLYFLWIELPRLAKGSQRQADRVLEAFTGWFHFLGEQEQTLAEHYRPHLAACGLTEIFQQRIERFNEPDWLREGCRLIGPELIFGQ